MKSSQKMMIAFLLNMSFAIIEVIFGLAFNSSAVLADAVHDTGDALAIGLSTLLEKISNKKEDSRYTLGSWSSGKMFPRSSPQNLSIITGCWS